MLNKFILYLLFAAVNIFVIFNFIFNFVLCPYTQLLESKEELIFTSILYRHGERNPEGFYPNDPYSNLSYWPDGEGMLTNTGKMEHYLLGQWLRKRYHSLIPDGKYHHELIYVQSTDLDRSLMSALANLAGMFYPSEQEMWSHLQWQPIPVHTIPRSLDKLLTVEFPCPKIQEEDETVRDSDILKRFNEAHKENYKYITLHTGGEIADPLGACCLYITLDIESLRIDNFVLPDWAKSVYPEFLHNAGAFYFASQTMTKTLKKLRGGPLLKDIITHMKQKRDGTLSPDRNIWVYSGHDKTIAALLNTMGVFEPHMPPFAATVMVELRKGVNEDFFVSVHYKNTTEEPTLLTIPGCTPSCPLDMFESLLADVIPEDWDKECQLGYTIT